MTLLTVCDHIVQGDQKLSQLYSVCPFQFNFSLEYNNSIQLSKGDEY